MRLANLLLVAVTLPFAAVAANEAVRGSAEVSTRVSVAGPISNGELGGDPVASRRLPADRCPAPTGSRLTSARIDGVCRSPSAPIQTMYPRINDERAAAQSGRPTSEPVSN